MNDDLDFADYSFEEIHPSDANMAAVTKGAAVVAQNQIFGLPVTPEEIQSELQLSEPQTRSLLMAESRSPQHTFEPFELEFQKSVVVSSAGFRQTCPDVVPFQPLDTRVSRTSFTSAKALPDIRHKLEEAFAALSVRFEASKEHKLWYSCSALSLHSMVEMAVRVYRIDEHVHLVEIQHTFGCRYSFSQLAAKLSQQLQVSFAEKTGTPYRAAPFCPPPFPEDKDPHSSSGSLEPSGTTAEFDMCSQLLCFVAPGAPRSNRLQGARAVGVLACSSDGSLIFDSDSGIKLACWVAGVAKESDDEELQSVAMESVANIAALNRTSASWIEFDGPAMDTVIENTRSLNHHVKRETLRAAAAFASKPDRVFAQKVFGNQSLKESLGAESYGPSDGFCKDLQMQEFARCTLRAIDVSA